MLTERLLLADLSMWWWTRDERRSFDALDKQAILQQHHHHSRRRCLFVLPFSLTATFSHSFSLSRLVFFFFFFLPSFAWSVPCEGDARNNFSQPRRGTWSFFSKTKAKTGVRRGGQQRPAATIVGRATRRRKRGKWWSRRCEREDATGGFLPRSISGSLPAIALCKALFFPSLAHSSSHPFFRSASPPPPPLTVAPVPIRLHRPALFFSFFCVYGTLGFSSRRASRTETIRGAVLPRRLRRCSFLHFDTSRTVILMRSLLEYILKFIYSIKIYLESIPDNKLTRKAYFV